MTEVPKEGRNVLVERIPDKGIHDIKEQDGQLSLSWNWRREAVDGHPYWFWCGFWNWKEGRPEKKSHISYSWVMSHDSSASFNPLVSIPIWIILVGPSFLWVSIIQSNSCYVLMARIWIICTLCSLLKQSFWKSLINI